MHQWRDGPSGSQAIDRAQAGVTALRGHAIEIAVRPENWGRRRQRTGERRILIAHMQHRMHTRRGQAEDGAGIPHPAAVGHAIETAVRSGRQSTLRPGSGAAGPSLVELVGRRQHSGGSQAKDGAAARWPAAVSATIKIPIAGQEQTAVRIRSAIRCAAVGELHQRGQHACGGDLEDRALVYRPAEEGRAIERAVRTRGQIAKGLSPPVGGSGVGELDHRAEHARGSQAKDGPVSGRPAVGGQAVIISVRSFGQVALGQAAFGRAAVAGEMHQRRVLPGGSHSKNGAVAGGAALPGGAIEIPVTRPHQAAVRILPGIGSTGTGEGHQRGQRASRSNPENRTAAKSAPAVSRAVEISIHPLFQAAAGFAAVGAVENHQGGQYSRRCQPEQGAGGPAALACQSVEISVRGADQPA